MTEPDPRSEQGGLALIKHIRDAARGTLEDLGHHTPSAVLLCQVNPNTGETFDVPQIIPVLCPQAFTESVKDAFSASVSQIIVAARACAVAIITESWWFDSREHDDPRRAVEELAVYRDEHGTIEGFPGVKEVLSISWEHVTSEQQLWRAPIVREGDRVTLGDWTSEAVPTADGRFTNLLPPQAYGDPVEA